MTAPRRLLQDTMVDVAFGAASAAARTGMVGVTGVALAVPIEVVMLRRNGQWQLHGDVPRLVTRTAFDTPPGRLEVTWGAA